MSRSGGRSSGKGGLVSHRCHLQVLDLITRKLGSCNMQKLNGSQFVHLFPFPSIQFQGQIFNILLRHLDKTSKNRNILTFSIRGRNLDFRPIDFALITGLKFTGWFEPPVESEFHRLYFRERYSISLVDIIEAFKLECCASNGDSLNSLKLACLMIVYGVFLTLGPCVNHVDMTYFHIIDDVDKFLCFPWGKIAYGFLVMRTHRARDVLENLLNKQKNIAFDANCFVLALQIWAYEVIPIVGRNCASRIDDYEHEFPRLRRWRARKPVRFDLLELYFSKQHTLTPQLPTENEEIQITPLGFINLRRENLESPFVDNEHGVSLPKLIGGKDEALSFEQTRRYSSGEHPDMPQPQPVISDEVSTLRRRVAVLEHMMHTMRPSPPSFEKELNKTPNKVRSKHEDKNLTVSIPQKKMHIELYTSEHLTKRVVSFQSGISKSSPNIGDMSSVPMLSTKKFKESPSLSSDVKHVNQTTVWYDPNEMGIMPELVDEFSKWRVKCARDATCTSLKIPCWKVGIIDSDWFDNLWTRQGWLTTSHIDALLTLLLVTSNNEPQRFSSDWSVIEMFCWDALCGTNEKILQARVGPYVVGHQPHTRPLHWAFARKVYGVGHVQGDHWVSYELDIDSRIITVFDSLSESGNWETLKLLFETFCRNIDKLCNDNHVWKLRGDNDDCGKKWSVMSFNHPPQQNNGYDCGVMAIKFIECLISRNSVSMIDADRCGFFRHYYCAKLYRISEVVPDIEEICL